MRTPRLASLLILLGACSSHPANTPVDAPPGADDAGPPPADGSGGSGSDGSGSSGGTAITLTLTNRPNTAATFSFLVAYQDGTGAWQLAPAPTGDVYTFDVSSPTWGVAWTCVTSGAAARSVSLYEFTVAERTSLTIDVPAACTDRNGADVALDGTISNPPIGSRLDVGFAGTTAAVAPAATMTYALQIEPATRDLLVGQETANLAGDLVISKAAVARGVAATGATTTKDVDFSAAQATQTATVSIARGNGQTAIASTTLYSAGGTMFPFVRQTNATNFSAASLAGALAKSGDVYDQQIEVDGTGTSAIVQDWVTAVANQTYTAPTVLGMPTTTVAAPMPYPQLHTTWSAYTDAVGYAWSASQALTGTACGASGGSCTVTWSATVSAGAAGASPSVAMPDLSMLAGWDHALELVAGTAVNGSVTAATSSAGAGDFPPAMPAPAGTQRVLVSAAWTATP